MTLKGVVVTVLVTLCLVGIVIVGFDYIRVREAASKGEAAWEFIDKAIKMRETAAKQAPTPPPKEITK